MVKRVHHYVELTRTEHKFSKNYGVIMCMFLINSLLISLGLMRWKGWGLSGDWKRVIVGGSEGVID